VKVDAAESPNEVNEEYRMAAGKRN
jgi:hypothetical protein